MINFLQYIYDEVKNKRLGKTDAIHLIHEYQINLSNNPLVIHPLVQRNTSDLQEQRFSTTLHGNESFLADHVIQGERFLPGVAYLEMARAAVKAAIREAEAGTTIRLQNIVWVRPIVVGSDPVEIHIGLYPEASGAIEYEIYRETEAERIIHSQGRAILMVESRQAEADLKGWQAECQECITAEQLYQEYRKQGVAYGPGHRAVTALYRQPGKVLAQLTLPEALAGTAEQYGLHPSIMDGAFQLM